MPSVRVRVCRTGVPLAGSNTVVPINPRNARFQPGLANHASFHHGALVRAVAITSARKTATTAAAANANVGRVPLDGRNGSPGVGDAADAAHSQVKEGRLSESPC